MNFRKRLIQFQGFEGRIIGFRITNFGWQETVICMHAVTVGQSTISQSVSRIFCDGLLKTFNTLVNAVLSSFVTPVAALKIPPVGFGAGGVGPREALLFLAGQT